LVEDHRNSSHYFEEAVGNRRLWSDLSPQGKLQYIAGDAALYDVPFKHFDEAVREVIGNSALAEAALRTVLRDALEFRSLEGLFPPDGRTEATPLADRFKEILDRPAEPDREPEHRRDRGIER
jgi:hypothetical protein